MSSSSSTTTTTAPSSQSDSESPRLPAEIEREIILRLPSKSVQRLTVVCKAWHLMITKDPTFVRSYNQMHMHDHQTFLLLKHPLDPFTSTVTPLLSLSSLPTTTTTTTQDQTPVPFPVQETPITGVEFVSPNPINGILCMILHVGISSHVLMLWNVSSGERLDVPVSRMTGLFVPMVRYVTVFGYDRGKDDYKVFRVVYLDSVVPTCEVFSLREFSWRKVVFPGSKMEGLCKAMWAGSVGTFVDGVGVGYWGGYKGGRKDRFFIVGYDFEKDRLRKVKLPDGCVGGGEMRFHSLWVYLGMLAMSVLRFGGFETGVTRHCIWGRVVEVEGFGLGLGMDGGGKRRKCWVKLFDIDLQVGPRRPVVDLVRSGEIVMLGDGDGDHVVYNPWKGVVKCLDVFDVDAVIPYVESLVCLRKMVPAVGSEEDEVLDRIDDGDEPVGIAP